MLKNVKYLVSCGFVQNFRVINSFCPSLLRLLHNRKFRSDNGGEETVFCALFFVIYSLADYLMN